MNSVLELVHDESEISARPSLVVVGSTPPPPVAPVARPPAPEVKPAPVHAIGELDGPTLPGVPHGVVRLDVVDTQPTPPPEMEDPADAEDAPRTDDHPSIPPVVDDTHGFFAAGDRASRLNLHHAALAEEEIEEDAPDRRFDPEVLARRERFQKTVSTLVILAAVLSAVAFGRSLVQKSMEMRTASRQVIAEPEAPATEPTTEAIAPRVEVRPAATTPAPSTPATATASAAVGTASADRAAVPTAAPPPGATAQAFASASATPSASASGSSEPAPARTPLEDKIACRKALERGKIDLAIEAGARSVAGDPSDAEAWLLLGSAYQDKGKWPDAVRAYRMCVREAKKGPVHECAAMLK